jgi:2-polyprenyl-3-methyl-5-hydroxy-6-metoxy-1,4-benzoquinol methylase
MGPNLRCPGCLGQSTTLHVVKNSYPIHRCSGCELLFVHPQPSKEELGKLYSASYFSRGNKYAPAINAHDDPNRLNDQRKIELIKRWCSRGTLLDVGCAFGGFLAVAREHGFEVEGIEIGEYAAEQARTRLHVRVANRDIYSVDLAPESYDVVTMWDVIEHLADPTLALEKIHRALRPGGYLALSTGDVSSAWARLAGKRWPLLTPPQHLYFFSQRSVSHLLQRQGFSVADIHHQNKWVTVAFVLFKAQESFGAVIKPLAAAVRWSGLQNVKFNINLGDIMTVVARKSPSPSMSSRSPASDMRR